MRAEASPSFAGWSAEARAVVERAVERHGGMDRWRALGKIGFTLEDLGGPLLSMKGLGRTFEAPRCIEVEPRALRARFVDFPIPGQEGRFEAGAVSLIDRSTGTPLVESPDHRKTFDGLAKLRRWRPLDGLYFFGYALCTYFSVPFILPELTLVGVRRARFRGESLTGVTVAFPARFPTHSEHQTFFFDETGLLRRHDYTADVVGSWARGAHFSEDYEEVNGMHLARRRFVRATAFGRATPVPVLHARLAAFRVS